MRAIYGLGETLVDILFKNGVPVSANPGGSVFNALVTLSRLGSDTYLITDIGDDEVGKIIVNFLDQNSIHTRYLSIHKDKSSTLALAFLDANNDATYQFYKSEFPIAKPLNIPLFTESSMFLFGSTLAIDPSKRLLVTSYLNEAYNKGSIILYDPNCRKNHTNDQEKLSYIFENMSRANIVRCSDEDLKNIYGNIALEVAIAKVTEFCENVIVTRNSREVICKFGSLRKSYPVPVITPISTIGAGDNFNAGILYALSKLGITTQTLNKIQISDVDQIITQALSLSSKVCMSMDNYIEKP